MGSEISIGDRIKEGNYTEGSSRSNGWGGAGYGSFVGAKAMQGLMAYYYDLIRPNNAVELNQCRFNHMGMNVVRRELLWAGLSTCCVVVIYSLFYLYIIGLQRAAKFLAQEQIGWSVSK